MIAKFTFNYNGGFEKKENAVFQQGSIGVDSYQVFAPFLTTTQVYIKTKRNGDLEFSLWKQLDYNSTIGGWLKTATQDELLVDGEMKVVFKFNNLVSQETSLWVRKGTLIVPEMTTYEALRDYVENQEIRIDQIINGTTDIAFDKTGTNLNSDFVEEAIKEVNTKSDANAQNITDMKDGTDAFTEILLSDGNGGTLRITYDGKDPIFTYRGITGEAFKNLFGEAEPASGVTFTHGMPIMYAGSIGGSGKRLAKPTVLSELAVNPNLFLGIVTEVTTEGHAIYNWYGVVNNLNTSGLTLGAPLYVGEGALTVTKPTKPLPTIRVGLVERVSSTVGQVSVRPDIGRYLGDLHNVYVNGSEVDGITIMYNGTTNRYEVYDLKGNILRIDTDIDTLQEDVLALETANMIKSFSYNTSTHVITFTHYDGSTTSMDLPLESAIVSASYDDVTKDITFVLQSGSTLVVPLDDLVSGLASETWVNTYFIPKTALKTSFSATPLDTNVISEKLAKDTLDTKIPIADIINDLTTGGATKVLSAEQGKTLQLAKIDKFLNQPIGELNGYTLKQVFEDGNILEIENYTTWAYARLKQAPYLDDGYAIVQGDGLFDTWYIYKTSIINSYNNHNIYVNWEDYQVDYVPTFGEDRRIGFSGNYATFLPNEKSKIYTNTSASNGIFIFGHQATLRNESILKIKKIKFISMTAKGITISKEKMDYWNDIYDNLKAFGEANATLQEIQNATNKYWGKKIVFVGDSITEVNATSTKRYYEYIQDDLKILPVNMGVSGTGFKKFQSEDKAYYQRILLAPNNADLYILIGSGNDLSDIENIGTASDTETTTIGGCINQTITNLLSINPSAKIILSSSIAWETSFPLDNSNMNTYSNLIKEIAYKNGIYYLDLLHTSGLRPNDATFRSLYYTRDGGSGTHPDENGHKWFYPLVKNAIVEVL